MKAVTTGNAVHYVCHAGHSYSPQTFLAARDDDIEAALWTATSAMQEQAAVLQELAEAARRAGHDQTHRRHEAAVAHITGPRTC
jgi:two-component system chemotaxis response regulator CheB